MDAAVPEAAICEHCNPRGGKREIRISLSASRPYPPTPDARTDERHAKPGFSAAIAETPYRSHRRCARWRNAPEATAWQELSKALQHDRPSTRES
jgi:hypothetical protein